MWRGMPYVYSWLERLNVVKMPNSSQLIYRLNAIFIKTPKKGFWNSRKMSLPFIWKINRHEERRTIWKREILSLRTYYKNWGEKRCVFSIRRPGNRTVHSLERSVYVCKKNPSVQNMIMKAPYINRDYLINDTGKTRYLETKMFRSYHSMIRILKWFLNTWKWQIVWKFKPQIQTNHEHGSEY